MDLFFTNMQLFCSQDVNWWTGVMRVTCELLWSFSQQLFGLSFWRHPFTAEDPLLNKSCFFIFHCMEKAASFFPQHLWSNNSWEALGPFLGFYLRSVPFTVNFFITSFSLIITGRKPYFVQGKSSRFHLIYFIH